MKNYCCLRGVRGPRLTVSTYHRDPPPVSALPGWTARDPTDGPDTLDATTTLPNLVAGDDDDGLR